MSPQSLSSLGSFSANVCTELRQVVAAAFTIDLHIGAAVSRLARRPAGDAGIVAACGAIVRYLYDLPECGRNWWILEEDIQRCMDLANALGDRLAGMPASSPAELAVAA